MNSRLVVVAVIEKGDHILFGRKKDDTGPYPNTWHIPGGGMRPETESIEEALRREVREETNLEITDLEPLGFDEDYEPNKSNEMTHYLFLMFRAKYLSGELRTESDLTKAKWVKKSDIKNYDLTRPSKKLFRRLGYI